MSVDWIIYCVQFVLSLVVISLLSRWFLFPKLDTLPRETALIVVLGPQLFRHMGMFALSQAAYDSTIPLNWASSIAIGDLLSHLSAVTAAILLHRRAAFSIASAWVATGVGLVCFVIPSVILLQSPFPIHRLYAAWFLPAPFVPAVLMSHLCTFRYLRPRQGQPIASTA